MGNVQYIFCIYLRKALSYDEVSKERPNALQMFHKLCAIRDQSGSSRYHSLLDFFVARTFSAPRSAWSKSAMISSMCSMPTEMRIKSYEEDELIRKH